MIYFNYTLKSTIKKVWLLESPTMLLVVSKLLVDNMSDRINVSDIEGDVAVTGTSGSIEVQNVTGNASVSGMSVE